MKLKLLKSIDIIKDAFIHDTFIINTNEVLLWVAQSHPEEMGLYIFHLKDRKVNKKINLRKHIGFKWFNGKEFALSYKDSNIMLVSFDEIHSWDINSFKYFKTEIAKNSLRDFPDRQISNVRLTGQTESTSIPFLLETMVDGETPFYAILDLSQPQNPKWTHNLPFYLNRDEFPLKVEHIYNQDLYHYHDISSISIINNTIHCYTTGFHTAYGKYSMDYSVYAKLDKHAKIQYEVDNCFGNFSSDLNYVILKPLYKKGLTKGRQFLFDINSKKEIMIDLPHGYAKWFIHDIKGDFALLSNSQTVNQNQFNKSRVDSLKISLMELV